MTNDELLLQLLNGQLASPARPTLSALPASEAPASAAVGGNFPPDLWTTAGNVALKEELERPAAPPSNEGAKTQHLMATRFQPPPPPQPQSGGIGDLGGLGKLGGGSGGGGIGSGSPWDMVFSMLGRGHGAIQGNDPNSPMVPGNRNRHGSDDALIGAGGPIGGAIGSLFGFGGAGTLAGQNIGATISDIAHGDIHNLGLDVSQNLPPIPGMRQPGWKGLVNGATGLPIGTLLGLLFK